jgi:hypothetical protein
MARRFHEPLFMAKNVGEKTRMTTTGGHRLTYPFHIEIIDLFSALVSVVGRWVILIGGLDRSHR